MPGQYGGLYQNYAGGSSSGANGDCSSNASGSATGGQAEDPPTGTTGRTSSMRARLIVPDRPEGREKVHRIRATTAADVDLRRDLALCVLGCCGRGRLMIVWSTRDPNDRSAASNGVNTPAATGALRREPSTDSRAGNGNASSGLVASQSASGGSGTTGGGSGGLSSLSWGGSDNVVTSDDPLDASVPSSEKLGRLQFSISYEFDEQTLTLRIIRAVDLAAKDFGGTSDPYVKIMLLPDKKRKLQTNVKRKTLNPRWNEVFAFEGFPYNKLMNKTLFMQVMDYDRFSRDDPIGEVCIPLSDFDLVNGQTLWKNLQPCKGHAGKLGELHLSLCYHPAPGRITVTIHKARQLKAKDINGLSDPYVKIWLIHDGKKVEKKKTETKERTLDPVFETSFDFEVPYERIRQTSLIVSVMDYDRMGRNEQIGQIVLGSKSGPMEMKHWNEMFAKTRQAVSQWHVLKDFG